MPIRLVVLAAAVTMAALSLAASPDATTPLQTGPPTARERRVALVIGNDRYPGPMGLQNARRDAAAIAAELSALGFETTHVEDATRARFIRALETVSSTLTPDDIALFYFAGHGAQIQGENYLVPVDYTGTTEQGLTLDAISASQVQRWLERARVSILVFDACRNNPYAGQRSSGRGLAPMEARGSLVAFATGAGQTANDNPAGKQGTFTGALLESLREPGLSLREVFFRVRQRVYEISRGQQFPAVYDGLLGDVILRPATAGAGTSKPEPPARPSGPPPAPASVSAAPSWLVGDFRGVNAASKSTIELTVDASGTVSGTADVGGSRPTAVRYQWIGTTQQMRDPTGAYVFEVERTGDGFRMRQVGNATNVVDYRRLYMPPGGDADSRTARPDIGRRATPDEQAALSAVIQSWARAWDAVDETAGRSFFPAWDTAALKKDRADRSIEKVTTTVACNPATIRRDQARLTCRATHQIEFKVQLNTARGAFGQRPPPRTQGSNWSFVLFWNGSAWMIEAQA